MNPSLTDMVEFDFSSEFLPDFCDNSAELLEKCETLLLEAETGGLNATVINELFRLFHTMKGDAGIVGLDDFRDVAHEVESALDAMRITAGNFTLSQVDALLEATRYLKSVLVAVRDGVPWENDAPYIQTLQTAFSVNGPTVVKRPAETLTVVNTTAAIPTEYANSEYEHIADTYLSFKVDDLLCAISVQYNREIINAPGVTRVPHVEDYISGVINHQGSILPVIHLGRRMGLRAEQAKSAGKILVVTAYGVTVGLLTDEVLAVNNWPARLIQKPDHATLNLRGTFAQGMVRHGEQVVLILDLEKILKREIE